MAISFEITLDGSRYLFKKKSRVLDSIKHKKFSELKLKVTYQRGITNSGTFKNKTDAITALHQWTEKELLEFVSNWT